MNTFKDPVAIAIENAIKHCWHSGLTSSATAQRTGVSIERVQRLFDQWDVALVAGIYQ
jgi:hypothetical protein